MLHKVKFPVCSEIHTKYTNSMWLQCRTFERQTLCYVKLQAGFKKLTNECLLKYKHTKELTAGNIRTLLNAVTFINIFTLLLSKTLCTE